MPATYQICLGGTLTATWMVSLGDLTVKLKERTSHGPVTILTGEVADQAALFGLLNNLYDLGYPLLSCSIVETVSQTDCEN
jgi:hypothetical protein